VFPALSLPTPVEKCASLGNGATELWYKNDGLTHPIYGGNKARKLVRLVEEAKRRGASRILTFGATGSHHLLTTALFAKAHGLRAAGIITRQPVTRHVEETLRATLAQGLETYPVRHGILLPFVLLGAYRRGDYLVPPGGANRFGSLAYADAVRELAGQIRDGVLPEPDAIVVPVGSGGTCAGLLAGVVDAGLATKIVAVEIVGTPFSRALIVRLAGQTLGLLRRKVASHKIHEHLDLDRRYIGRGYGWPTPEGERAFATARDQMGLELDGTYTAKTFAKVLDLLKGPGSSPYRRILYWHTLSARPFEPLLTQAAPLESAPASVRKLLA
jgi:1-aminocyclopropane-1-carboxylate deaminase/D-cysteine desulfhydrase-like pyridoxal-dependent ACC family enzyme